MEREHAYSERSRLSTWNLREWSPARKDMSKIAKEADDIDMEMHPNKSRWIRLSFFSE